MDVTLFSGGYQVIVIWLLRCLGGFQGVAMWFLMYSRCLECHLWMVANVFWLIARNLICGC